MYAGCVITPLGAKLSEQPCGREESALLNGLVWGGVLKWESTRGRRTNLTKEQRVAGLRYRKLEAVSAVALAVVQHLEPERVAEAALDEALKVVGAQGGWIHLLDQREGELRLLGQRRLSQEVGEKIKTLRLGQGLLGEVARAGKPMLLDETSGVSGVPELGGWKSVIVVPLASKGRVIGVLGGASAKPKGLSLLDLELMQAMADVIAPALENACLYREAREQALTDPLTGLHNYRYLEERLVQELSRSQRSGQPLALALIDVDGLKAWNDRFGHEEGDRLLRTIAEVLRDGTRLYDVAVRYGGDEFVLVLSGLEAPQALGVMKRIISRLGSYRAPGAPDFEPSISVGLACYPAHAASVPELLRCADRALYEGKRQGVKGRITFYSPGIAPF